MSHSLAVLVENHPGVLARVSGLFARRGYNIDSLTVCSTDDPSISRMTIVVNGDEQIIEQVTKQLHKLVVVHKVVDLTNEPVVDRELALVRVKVNADTRSEILQTVDIFRGKVVDIGRTNITVELTGAKDKIDAFVRTVRPYGVVELVRTGTVVIARSEG